MRSVALVVALVACLHVGAWAVFQTQASPPNIDGVMNSVSYSPYRGSTHPDDPGNRPSEAQIRADLKALAPYTKTIRLYASTGGWDLVPSIANEFGLKVTLGIWLGKDEKRADKDDRRTDKEIRDDVERNKHEVRAAIDLQRKNRNVNGIVVGNETLYRDELPVQDLLKYIKQVKREVGGAVPVTSGEIQSEYFKHPELGYTVDFIAAHVLPYWNGIAANAAVDQAVEIYERLRQTFPGKRVVIAEFGWPSAGYNRQIAYPGKLEQANVVRAFISRAQALGIDYNIIEAYDQPWKTAEGSVGAYWGLFDGNREPKFTWTGPITNSDRWQIAAIAVAVGILVSLPIVGIAGATLMQVLLLAVTAHAVGAWAATVFDYWNSHYFVFGSAFALGLGTLLLIPLVLIALWRIEEIAAVLFGRQPLRLLPPIGGAIAAPISAAPLSEVPTHPSVPAVIAPRAPKVSIHIPAYMEPPEMLKATLDAVARLNYPNFECILVINNTPNPAFWQPIEEHCATLGERFRFINAPKLDGYKAGALRLALAQTAPDTEIIGIIDADYEVAPDWLGDLVPVFADPKVGLVQAPQDHRDGERSPLHHAMNGEYAGFFDIGMVQRNEVNAIIVHGTMCLIRLTALQAAGGW
jgi:exo-beta-1,3-glucanase (GH17 family)